MPGPKKKILWVVYDFNQAGGQRYVYEICKSLDKEKYEIDVLRLAPHGYDDNWDHEYYYQLTLDAGCRVLVLDDLLANNFKAVSSGSIFTKLSNRLKGVHHKSSIDRQFVQQLMANYAFVNFSGLNAYKTLCIGRGIEAPNGIIHILTARFQDPEDIYAGFDKNYPYQFVSSFTSDILEIELAGFTNYRHVYYPLCFDVKPFEITSASQQEIYTIAVFTRLSSMKPLDPYFYGIKLLLEKGMKVRLYVYGAGSAEKEGFLRQLNYLHLQDHVVFKGHLVSMQDELKKGQIDLVWFQSNNQIPAGYAALEIAQGALPQIFWEFSSRGIDKEIGIAFPSFTSITEFTDFSAKLLNDKVMRKELGLKQQQYVLTHNSNKHITVLEAMYDS